MKPIFLSVENKKIACYQKGVADTTICFLHGNSLSAATFQHQFEEPCFEGYQLLAIDLPGHGASDRLETPSAYAFTRVTSIIIDVLQQLQLNKVVLVGHSYGGHLAIRIAKRLDTIRGLLVVGTPPLKDSSTIEEAFQARPEMALAFKPTLDDEELSSLAELFCAEGTPHTSFLKELLRKADGNFRAGNAETLSLEMEDEIGYIHNLPYKVGVALGEHDTIVNADYYRRIDKNVLWNQHPIEILNAGHTPQLETPALFNAMLLKYLQSL